jgi:hypothetical protein
MGVGELLLHKGRVGQKYVVKEIQVIVALKLHESTLSRSLPVRELPPPNERDGLNIDERSALPR